MNLLKMSESEIYKLGLRTLIKHLGLDGTTRFLGICKPHKDDIKVRGQTLSPAEMEEIREKVYNAYGTKRLGALRDLSQMPDRDFYKLGINVIFDQLGPVGMTRFIRIRRPGTGDYTAERHKWLDKLDKDTVLEGIQQIQQKYLTARTEDKQ